MSRENVSAKARRYLTEGRVIVTYVAGPEVTARVRGDGAVYDTEIHGPVQSCSCRARSTGCAHLHALRLVTAPWGGEAP